ncbi:MAG: transposase zinc-binding domain-containing protein [Desulfobacteraceae bacterium]|nr:transposase zinc-binding domain-containing protein [Desulfobacteraceae bacterium]
MSDSESWSDLYQLSDCNYSEWKILSGGHCMRPQCQNHEATKWIERQQNKLLPVHYMVTLHELL